MTQRQHVLNDLYAVYRDSGCNDATTRLRIKEDFAEIHDAALRNPDAVDLEKYLEQGPLLNSELDTAEEEYNSEG